MARKLEQTKGEETWVAALRSLLVQFGNTGPTQLADLPVEILFCIVEQLPLPSFLSASRSCRLFRLSLKSIRESYLANLPPFAVIMKIHGRRKIIFNNIMNGETYHTTVISYVNKLFRGIFGGFLIFENIYGIWFSHPVTGTTLEFHKPLPLASSFYKRVVLVEILPDNDYLIVILHEGTISVSHFGTSYNWPMISLCCGGKALQIIDLAASKENVLALTHMGNIATMVYSNSSPSFELIMMKERRFRNGSNLVISVEGDPMVVEFDYSNRQFQIFKADLGLKEWVVVTNLGNQALFIDETGVRLCDPRCWRGLPNHLYYLNSNLFSWCVSPLGGSAYKSMYLLGHYTTFVTSVSIARSWYFPHLAFSMTRFYNNLQVE